MTIGIEGREGEREGVAEGNRKADKEGEELLDSK